MKYMIVDSAMLPVYSLVSKNSSDWFCYVALWIQTVVRTELQSNAFVNLKNGVFFTGTT
jgi:hypothetical protein